MATVLVLGVWGASIPAAQAEERTCRGTIGAVTVDNLRVRSGRGAAAAELRARSTVGGSVQVVQGGRATVRLKTIGGSLLYDSNCGSLVADRNTIGSDLRAFQNTGAVSIVSNSIEGNLQCTSNTPAPTGGGNVVQGNKEDQCAKL